MFEKHLIEQAAPTLAGIKPASLFPYCAESLENAVYEINEWNNKLSALGIKIRILCSCEKRKRTLVYVYRVSALSELLSDCDTVDFLSKWGYDASNDLNEMLCRLTDRIGCGSTMPHEIGVFLGYPLEDVIGFIENNGKNHSFCGYWKAYGNPDEARLRYRQLKSCCTHFRECYRLGVSALELAVSA